MGIKVRPINLNDIKETYGEVKHVINSSAIVDQSTVESNFIFGDKSVVDDVVNGGIYNRRGYIDLALPVVNFFLAGDDMKAFTAVLGYNCKEIANGDVLYSKSQNKFFKGNELGGLKYSSDILMGGELLQYLLSVVDIDQRIESLIKGFVYGKIPMRRKKGKEIDDLGTVSRDSGKYWIIDEYYFNPLYIMEEEEETELVEAIAGSRVGLVKGYLSPLVSMLAVRGHMDRLHFQVLKKMVVLPIGYRPTIDKKRDPLTKAYNKVVRVNNELKTSLKYSNVLTKDIRVKYKDLVTEVRNVMVKKGEFQSDQFKPIVELLKGKSGSIRDKMQGTRSDYTGRSVIVVDPYMSVDTIGIPRVMAEKLMELEVIRGYKTRASNKSPILAGAQKIDRLRVAGSLLEGKYALIGRQPTLYFLGIQAFKVKIVEGNAIVLSPLVAPAFNGDFDGDQMHATIPVTPEAQKEVQNLMASTKNVFLPRSGDCHIAPRQELIYGLWKASTVKVGPKSETYTYADTAISYNEIYEKVCKQEISVYDEIKLGGLIRTAGYCAIRACLGAQYGKYKFGVSPLTRDDKIEDKAVSESWFKLLLKEVALDDLQKFISITNKLVRVGFAIANIFPPNISVLNHPDVSHLIAEFEATVAEREELFNKGFETEMSFTSYYDQEYTKLEAVVKKELKEGLGNGNGYMEMVVSGARGSMSNVLQLFGMKGRVMKNDQEAFNAILKHPLATQLTGLEHFITAYGSRQGLVDKVIETFAPGYLSRQMSHAASQMSITTNDCGTTDGLEISYDVILQFMPKHLLTTDATFNNKLVRDYTSKLLVGRYIVGVDHEIKTLEDAFSVYNKRIAKVDNGELVKLQGVKLRSPITCKDPCCVKCYGVDLGTNTTAVVGLPIGYIAAQSIGEPGTQLTMKNFQSGGVAGVTNLTSSFDQMGDYLELYDLRRDAEEPITYDYIAPVEGFIDTIARGDGTKELQIKDYNSKGELTNKLRKKIILYDEVKLKEYVKRGESIQVVQNNLNICEILEYRTAIDAQRYLVLMLYNIFQKEVFVSFKHFEVMVATMTFNICLKGNKYFKTGLYYTLQEYYAHDRAGCEFETTLIGIKRVPSFKNDVMSSIFMEDIRKGITRSVLLSGYDSLNNPLVRTTFGLNLGVGSDVPGYVERRGNV